MTEEERRKSEACTLIKQAVGGALVKQGRDWVLPDGRIVSICYSKSQHEGKSFFVGLPNRLKPDHVLVLLLGDFDLVFPRAGALLRYKDAYSPSSDGRPVPDFYVRDGKPVLRISRLDLTIPVDDRVNAYADLRAESEATVGSDRSHFGRPFVPDDENVTISVREPFHTDPDVLDRGTRGHRKTRNSLAAYLQSAGIEPRDPEAQPLFDLAWRDGGVLFVAEVKSLTSKNEEHQLRLGLGQVLRYRDQLAQGTERVVAVLVVEREPSDLTWLRLCSALGVPLVWPAAFDRLFKDQ